MSATEPRLVHEALVYSSDEEFLERLVPFLQDGLAASHSTMVVLSPNKSALLREALGQDAQRVSFGDASTIYRRPAHAIAEYRRLLDAELSRPNIELVRVIGEIPFGPTSEGHAEWARYESVFNRGFAAYRSWVVCGYDTRALPEQIVADALRTHPMVSTRGHRDTNAGYIETDELVERPVRREPERADVAGHPLSRLTVTKERDLAELRRVVAAAARAAGLASSIVDDVTLAAAELARDALSDARGEASVEVTRDGVRWHCDVTDRESTETACGEIGLSIARLISERVELASWGGAHTVRMTFEVAGGARQRILDAASELFYQNGIRATGVASIISQAGVAKATFFHHFPAKNDLVIAWLQQPASRWFDRIRTELDAKTESPASKLLTFFDLLGEWFAQDDFRGCAFQNAAAETPAAAHALRQATHDYALEIQHYLRRTADDAGLSNPARAAKQLHLLAQGAIATAVAMRSPDAAEVARAAAKRLLTRPERSPA
ncbi:MAG: MEDS domain-containing protein [Actinomycetota bacterium]|nr:MEDS domain-containing protein [Actinomycetota bacterium]